MASDGIAKIRNPLRSAVDTLREFAYARPLPSRYRKPILARPRLGLTLSGGFAHGLAHLGVLKVLAGNQIQIDALAGTSVGSVVAAAFASGSRLDVMIEEGRKIRWKTFGRWTVDRLGLATNERMETMLRKVLRCTKFEELAIPLAIVAADLSTGEAVTFKRGDLLPPVRASCSFPGLFVPISYQGRLLVDGAIVASVPVEALRDLGVDIIIAVNLRSQRPRQAPANIFQVIGQAFQIAQGLNQRSWRKGCDVIIEPDVSQVRWDEFGRADELIQAGERAALRMMPAIRALVHPRKISLVQSVFAP
jgi:NTE family protein